jgi:hypothetical protein
MKARLVGPFSISPPLTSPVAHNQQWRATAGWGAAAAKKEGRNLLNPGSASGLLYGGTSALSSLWRHHILDHQPSPPSGSASPSSLQQRGGKDPGVEWWSRGVALDRSSSSGLTRAVVVGRWWAYHIFLVTFWLRATSGKRQTSVVRPSFSPRQSCSLLAECHLSWAALGKHFADCIRTFVKCFWHSTNPRFLVVFVVLNYLLY